jgi:pimeloyl-ACP methyl ester carboxylesterase
MPLFPLFEAEVGTAKLLPAKVATEVSDVSKPVVLFIHGYPDDETLWKKNLTPSLLSQYRVLLVRLPHYGGKNSKFSLWGLNFTETRDSLAATVRAHVPEKSGPVHIVIGDWGSIIGLQFQDAYPELVRSIVTLDVGPIHTYGKPDKEELHRMIDYGKKYQYILIVAFLLAHFIPFFGESMGRYLCKLVFDGFRIKKLGIHDEDYINSKFTPFSNYWYYYMHRNLLLRYLGFIPLKKGKGSDDKMIPACPTFLLHGKQKPFKFFILEWADALKNNNGKHKYKEVDCFHWIQWEMPEEFNKDLEEWLQSH